jgi:hypothetical protein
LVVLRVGKAASQRLRRSRPPAQGCGRQTATLGPYPTKRFNPNGVAPHTPFSHPSRPEPPCGSIVTPLTPRVGLIPFGRPWAGGRKPFGLGGRPPFRNLPRGGWGRLGAAGGGWGRLGGGWGWSAGDRPTGISPRFPAVFLIAVPIGSSTRWQSRFPTPTAFPSSSPRLRSPDRYLGTISHETFQPQRGCAPYAVLPSVPAGTALRFNRYSLPGWASFHSADPGLEAVSPSGWGADHHSATFLGAAGGGAGDRQTSLVRRPQSGTAILAVTATGHRLEACASFLHRRQMGNPSPTKTPQPQTAPKSAQLSAIRDTCATGRCSGPGLGLSPFGAGDLCGAGIQSSVSRTAAFDPFRAENRASTTIPL